MAVINWPSAEGVLSSFGLPPKRSVMNTPMENAAIAAAGVLHEDPASSGMNMVNPMSIPGAIGMYVGKAAKGWANLPKKFTNLADKRQRAEISDYGAHVKENRQWEDLAGFHFEMEDHAPFSPPDDVIRQYGHQTDYQLKDILHHPVLYKQYPDIGNVRVRMNRGTGASFNAGNMTQPTNKGERALSMILGNDDVPTITIGHRGANKPENFLHEVMHWIQEKEGFARGANSGVIPQYEQMSQSFRKQKDELLKLLSAGKMSKEEYVNTDRLLDSLAAHDRYMRHAGEIEARDVTNRFFYGPNSLMRNSPYYQEAEHLAKYKKYAHPYSGAEYPLPEWIIDIGRRF